MDFIIQSLIILFICLALSYVLDFIINHIHERKIKNEKFWLKLGERKRYRSTVYPSNWYNRTLRKGI